MANHPKLTLLFRGLISTSVIAIGSYLSTYSSSGKYTIGFMLVTSINAYWLPSPGEKTDKKSDTEKNSKISIGTMILLFRGIFSLMILAIGSYHAFTDDSGKSAIGVILLTETISIWLPSPEGKDEENEVKIIEGTGMGRYKNMLVPIDEKTRTVKIPISLNSNSESNV